MIEKILSILKKDSNKPDAIALVPGSNFQYLTGGQFFLMERPLVLIISKDRKFNLTTRFYFGNYLYLF